jgi:uncharacterized protein YciI
VSRVRSVRGMPNTLPPRSGRMSPMPTYAVRYTYDRTKDDTRDAVRPAHRAYLSSLGELLGSGPLVDGAPGALLVLRTPDRASLDTILAADPFALDDVISETDVREWDLVLGPWSA